MDGTLDGNDLKSFSWFRCPHGHVLGIIRRVRVERKIEGALVKYRTPRVFIFERAIDINHVPAQIRIAGQMDGNMLSMTWRCGLCGDAAHWDPNADALAWLSARYGNTAEDVLSAAREQNQERKILERSGA